MEYSFQRYLVAKQTVDDRSLNRHVLDALRENLPHRSIRVIEAGAGMGNMLGRLLSWNVFTRGDYVLEDGLRENIRFASERIPMWVAEAGMHLEQPGDGSLRVFDRDHDVRVTLRAQDIFDFIAEHPAPADLLIANALLDLLPLPQSLPKLLSLTANLAWLTINIDGLTALEPEIDPALDAKIERLYHASMDTRITGGDSRAGRHLFEHLRALGARVLAVGSSDWVVHAVDGRYPADEAYFLYFILHFFEESLAGHPELEARELEHWLQARRGQIARGELLYIAHQLDYLVQV